MGTGLQSAYNTEAVLWGEFIEQRLDEFGDQVKVAALVMNNDFGKAYDAGFRAWLSQSAEYKASGPFGSGLVFGWAMVQALQAAGQLDGCLSRSNLIPAIRSMDMTHPMTLPGVAFTMNGNADAYLTEGSDVAATTPPASPGEPKVRSSS